MTKTVEITQGMARKRERHLVGKWRHVGKTLVAVAATLFFTLTCVWTQALAPSIFDSYVAFEAVLNEYDAHTGHWSYIDFEHRSQEFGTDLFTIYLWHVSNPQKFVEDGFKPRLEEKGPYAFVKEKYRYDIRWPGASTSVTFKEWWYLSETEVDACRLMHFRQGLSEYNVHTVDRPGGCATDSSDTVTILNPKFLKVLAKWGLRGFFGELSQRAFARIEDALTGAANFPRAVKADLVPEAIEDAFAFREAVHVATVLDGVFACLEASAPSTAAAVFAGRDADFAWFGSASAYCASRRLGGAQFGSARRLEARGAARLTAAQAADLLDASKAYSILNFNRGVPLWVGAARHLGRVVDSTVLEDTSTASAAAFKTLVDEVGNLTSAAGDLYVRGLVDYLYLDWLATPATKDAARSEWAGHDDAERRGGCDVGVAQELRFSDTSRAARLMVPLHATGGEASLYRFDCAFGVRDSLAFRGEAFAAAPPLNVSMGAYVADFAERDTRNELGIHTEENLPLWWLAYEWCNATRHGASTACAGMGDATTAATVTLPSLWAAAEGADLTNATVATRVEAQMCAVAGHLYTALALDSSWQELYAARHVSQRARETFYPGQLEDLGYAQWAGGSVTLALWEVPSVINLRRQGHWKFYAAEYQVDYLEFPSQAMAIGYHGMNMTLEDGKLLLSTLAAEGARARRFRGHIAHVSTSYRCDGADCPESGGGDDDDDDDGGCAIAFAHRDDTPTNTDLADLWGTCEPFSSFCDCTEGGSFFVEQNAYANFSEAVPWRSFPHDTAHTISSRTRWFAEEEEEEDKDKGMSDDTFRRAAALLDETFQSSTEGCAAIQKVYTDCSLLLSEPRFADWLTLCTEWETLITDPTFGIYCDESTILQIDTAYVHDYQTTKSHPYPRKRGNVIAFWLQEWMEARLLVEGRLVCDDPAVCDFAMGGLFVTHPARTVLFEGYVDRVAMALLNVDLRPHGLLVRCLNRTVVAATEYCEDVENAECTGEGFEVVHFNRTAAPDAAVFTLQGARRLEWFQSELVLNTTDLTQVVVDDDRRAAYTAEGAALPPDIVVVDSPVFAIYPGKLWRPPNATSADLRANAMVVVEAEAAEVVAFHKATECANRFLGGPQEMWASCEITLHTGKEDLGAIAKVASWHGNETLDAGHGFEIQMRTATGTLGSQLEPYGWEGWQTLNFSYLFRFEGLKYLANDTIYLTDAQHLLLFELERQEPDDLDIGMGDNNDEIYVEWPTRVLSDATNYTRRVWVRANRYEATRRSFTAARRRAANHLRDPNGEAYTVPIALASLEYIAGTPAFVSLPHFYGNEVWGGTEVRQVYMDTTTDRRRHSYYVDVEPITGVAVRDAIRYQYNFRVERSMLFPSIISSQERCRAPTATFNDNGYGCFMFFPVWWVSEDRVLDGEHAVRLKRDFLDIPLRVFIAGLFGAGATLVLLVLGAIPWYLTNKREKVFRSRIYVD